MIAPQNTVSFELNTRIGIRLALYAQRLSIRLLRLGVCLLACSFNAFGEGKFIVYLCQECAYESPDMRSYFYPTMGRDPILSSVALHLVSLRMILSGK